MAAEVISSQSLYFHQKSMLITAHLFYIVALCLVLCLPVCFPSYLPLSLPTFFTPPPPPLPSLTPSASTYFAINNTLLHEQTEKSEASLPRGRLTMQGVYPPTQIKLIIIPKTSRQFRPYTKKAEEGPCFHSHYILMPDKCRLGFFFKLT